MDRSSIRDACLIYGMLGCIPVFMTVDPALKAAALALQIGALLTATLITVK